MALPAAPAFEIEKVGSVKNAFVEIVRSAFLPVTIEAYREPSPGGDVRAEDTGGR
jgi:hypothetical protein